ncbi:MAG TPA: hypothetical protein PLN21_14635 [Gemmatales bacterium]|nr:hypothetical protein [Gemmatales bacterium]
MSQTISNRDELNIEAIDAQIRAWVKAGQQWGEIINLAKDTWPALPKDYVLASIKLIGRILRMEKPVPIQPFRDLSIIHRKRSRRIKKLEARLETNDASISLETLYRGLLRDQEAGCHKIMAVQRQMEEDRKQLVKDEVATERDAKIFQQVFEQRMQQQQSAAERDKEAQPTPAAKPTLMKTLSFLIGFVMAWFFASSCSGSRQTSDRHLIGTLGEFCYCSKDLRPGFIQLTPSILLKLFVPRTVPAFPPGRRKPADLGIAC